ncbi:pullulanase-type alpha-1,6-glucosidase [Microbacterium paludicola]|uniref:Pullulanase-type alpha-1,6-glucosidase n=1 Tax=Microbacterium paludicola TaxID=300019 RepID=A0A4Y9FXJ2_9MICO|nr:pullulanase-type alpha-1,6-glucosidase [Microbacterium paludicola]MBF0815255.1 pullulanase-type alpha-1,6-glucosidase [Microbacterium paludicola]TFU34128.1 pullulanase-type alpha-1,6-glucosidase [Microbacterium paludicola]
MSKTTRARRRALALLTIPLFALSGAAVAIQPAVAADRTVALVGSLQSELGCAEDWQPACAATELAPTGAEGVYAAEFEVPAGTYEYKVALNDAWDEAYGLDGGGDNIPLTVAGPTTVRFIFDDGLKRVGLELVDVPGGYTDADAALVTAPVRQPGADERFYFVMTDRFANGDASNDTGGIEGDRMAHGFDPVDKGFYQGGDIAGLRSQLDYIEGLGTTALWLTPSFANRPVQGSGADASAGYHGYWITDFTRIDPHLGTNEELAALIDEAHARGIKVYFDIITNHTADVIDYAEKQYAYVDQATSPYTDAQGAAFDPADFAGGDTFPALDPATSFAYTPVVTDTAAKTPAWLNDPTLYHNRGDSTWSGESVTHGDFSGLDDLMTEHPTVVNGFVEVYKDWIDLGIDGFRIDTVKHVNFEFWEQWSAEVLDYAHGLGKDDFFMFGEVYDADPAKLAPYVRGTDMNSVLDFTFQSAATGFAAGNSAKSLQSLFAGDDRYTTPDKSATALPTFLGNHDMGRVGHFLLNTGEALERDELAHELMYLTRGQPVVYYGDEQGFAGLGGDKSARQTLFATQVAEYADQPLVTGETAGSIDRYATDAPLYGHIATLAQLREAHPALATGAQIERHVDDGAGVYAFSRVDRDEKVEYLVAVNNAEEAREVTVPALTAGASFAPLYGADAAISSDADAAVTVTVPALSAVVYRADRAVTADAVAPAISLSAPAAGAGLEGQAAVSADVEGDRWIETSFAWRVAGEAEWTHLGTAEDTDPRVYHDVAGLARGTVVEYRAVVTDAAGQRSAASTFASVGNAVTLAESEEPETPISMVTVPGSHNSELGCAGDWDPACAAAELTLRPDGIYEGTFELPAGDYEYKVAIDGSWAINYGQGGARDGANFAFTHAGGSITFLFDPRSNVVQSTAEGPIVTVPGSFQDELGCPGDWAPDCLASLLSDGDRDGVYELTTDAVPDGSYAAKVAHGRSWTENYGADGARDGADIPFTVADGVPVSFRYTIADHRLEITAAAPPLAGTGEERAHWIDAETIAWPADLGQPEGAQYALHASEDAGLALEDGAVTGGDEIALTPIEGGLTEKQRERFPALAQHLALRVEGQDAAALLRGQLAVSQRASDGTVTAYTGVQIPGVLDDLYAEALEDIELGVTFEKKAPTFRVWAPTAQTATLLTWDAGAEGDPVRHEARLDEQSGVWEVRGGRDLVGDEYAWEVHVFAPSTGAIETNVVTDPYSVALTTNSTRSVAIDLSDKALQPKQWRKAEAPDVEQDVDRAIYELHIRDFSISDESVPADLRGTYSAFTRDSDGTRQLRQLSDAGITTVHLLPSFDIATIEEDRSAQATPDCDLAALPPASEEQQACVGAVAGQDGFNWGYDPYHFTVPEGSYAVDPEGGARVAEFRSMVGALHDMGLEVVLDQVFNHTAQSGQGEKSVLDRLVPGYYHRLNAAGDVEKSTCCENVATEHAAAQKLMVDSVVTWARDYKVDGFRFDLMGHHSTANMKAVRDALDELTEKRDGVDGKSVYLYGEGWDFGEVAGDALFEQAKQGNLGGTGIGSFNDRLRDAVHGGSPVDSSSTYRQGFGTGLGTDPNGDPINGTTEQALADLGHETDLVKLGLAGNLAHYELLGSDGEVHRGDELDYRGAKAGYADEPSEIVNYVDAHDNETLYDLSVLKLPVDTSMADRVRMNTLSLATVTLSQSVSFWHAGTELLRSKSLDRNSYDSGDWFNRIDWDGEESTFGSGLPPEADNGEKWGLMAPLLENPALKPSASDIKTAEAAALDLLEVRSEVDLLTLGSADRIEQKVSFPKTDAAGTIAMVVDDRKGRDADRKLAGALVFFNASPEPVTQKVAGLEGRSFALTPAQAKGSDPVVKETTWDAATGTITIPARTVAVLVERG